MNSEEIYQRMLSYADRYHEYFSNDKPLHIFANELKKEDDADVFFGLIPAFHSWELDCKQEVAGRLLAYRRPAPQSDLKRIILDSIPHYDISVEQFPWYLGLSLGMRSFKDLVSELQSDTNLSEKEQISLRIFLGWGSMPEEFILDRLKPLDEQTGLHKKRTNRRR